MPAEATVEVTLRSSDGLDGFEERRFTIRPHATVNVGRASKNTQKPNLMMAADNAFIDSPVVSREHAVLSTDTATPTPSVLLTDSGSMHGTMVNGEKLEPRKPLKLSNGDVLQFGIDVTRNESFYVARKYTFESHVADDPFSHGFTVPEADSSEDDEVETDEALSAPPPRYGSQTNPVTIDDTEDITENIASPDIIEIEEDGVEVVIQDQPAPPNDETHEPRPSSSRETGIYFEETTNRNEPVSTQYAFVVDHSSDDGDYPSVYSSDEEESQGESDASQVGSESDSVVEPASDAEASDEEFGGNADAVRRRKMEVMLLNEQQKSTPESKPPIPGPSTSSVTSPALPTPPMVPAPQRQEPLSFFGQSPSKAAPRAAEAELPAIDACMGPMSMFDDTFGDSILDFSIHAPHREHNSLRWFADESPPTNMFSHSNAEYSPDLFGRPSRSAAGSSFQPQLYATPQPQPFSDHTWTPQRHHQESMASVSATATGVETPSPAPTSEVSSAPPQPVRRTKVSIPEIVEDAPQQPPTPTSITGSLKRKADVLDEEDAVEECAAPAEADMPIAPAIEVRSTPTEERPKKRIRGIGGAMTQAAAYLIPGAALTVAVITSLPEGFWLA
ncbi:hypothetical protein BU26DRAFT_287315 [Trematosphaeria pertusa]|uniref:FHA domain-containing protein n=1 Tax=Trematosphaeria pertusa TaxID=390896 RepID=A0A6A6IHJ3_9PLEO|nr:uncharacterized protein BU26DRAFT_287315 [Trematosphaeria pertusa]KAF2249679.1 hypothetical protein BU26DRAFT_287315 [Trematosphaeria pertusa]